MYGSKCLAFNFLSSICTSQQRNCKPYEAQLSTEYWIHTTFMYLRRNWLDHKRRNKILNLLSLSENGSERNFLKHVLSKRTWGLVGSLDWKKIIEQSHIYIKYPALNPQKTVLSTSLIPSNDVHFFSNNIFQ